MSSCKLIVAEFCLVADLRNICVVVEIHSLENIILLQSIVLARVQKLPNVLHLRQTHIIILTHHFQLLGELNSAAISNEIPH